jgi:hypothetical protein
VWVSIVGRMLELAKRVFKDANIVPACRASFYVSKIPLPTSEVCMRPQLPQELLMACFTYHHT